MSNIILESSRGYDCISLDDELLRRREIFLVSEVNAQTCNEVIKQLIYLEREDNTKEITIYINSPGGECQSGLCLYDTIRMLKSPVRTVCIGTAASMGSILFLAAQKREMLAHSKLMIHDPAFGGNHDISGRKPHEIQAELDDLNKCREVLARIIAERSGRKIEDIYKLTADDTYFDAEEAMEFGLATGIMSSIDGRN